LLLGFGIARLPSEQRLPIHHLLQSLFQIMMQITRWIVAFMPIAIWAFTMTFVTELFAGLTIPSQVGWYLVTILSANLVQGAIILPLFLWFNGISPWQAFRKMLPALSFAFFSKSSSAAMPSAIDCAERHLQVDPKVARFSFPLCTSINMNACAGFIIITVLFVAQSNGAHFTVTEQLTWILIATVAAIGNAGVPMGCFFIASALLSTMNVPLTLMGIILPFYALLDMLESAINLWSDACVTVVVDQKSKTVELPLSIENT
jgi:Na+/H+-dicarboxylate symporter